MVGDSISASLGISAMGEVLLVVIEEEVSVGAV